MRTFSVHVYLTPILRASGVRYAFELIDGAHRKQSASFGGSERFPACPGGPTFASDRSPDSNDTDVPDPPKGADARRTFPASQTLDSPGSRVYIRFRVYIRDHDYSARQIFTGIVGSHPAADSGTAVRRQRALCLRTDGGTGDGAAQGLPSFGRLAGGGHAPRSKRGFVDLLPVASGSAVLGGARTYGRARRMPGQDALRRRSKTTRGRAAAGCSDLQGPGFLKRLVQRR